MICYAESSGKLTLETIWKKTDSVKKYKPVIGRTTCLSPSYNFKNMAETLTDLQTASEWQ